MMNTLVRICEGDMRKSITTLQTAQRLVSGTEHLTPELVQEVAGIIPVGVIEALLVDVNQTTSPGSRNLRRK